MIFSDALQLTLSTTRQSGWDLCPYFKVLGYSFMWACTRLETYEHGTGGVFPIELVNISTHVSELIAVVLTIFFARCEIEEGSGRRSEKPIKCSTHCTP